MTPKQILIAARAKIEAPERWTKGETARNSKGDPVEIDADDVACLCSLGAIGSSIGGESAVADYFGCTDLIEKATGTKACLAEWNDHPKRTHAEVLAAFDRAIELAGERK